ncbi:unnamed protein product [Dracunculus medinensis]|uniref:MARVEL domain-containing protein n=1 Tax=Dracunculus medinensis TaxID=318479 RepID=A0A0N4U3Y0_DRAME|nr:unnamed protein product [Dracunculus medinensis]
MNDMRAYGSGMAGGKFDINLFLKKPTVLFRILALSAGFAQWLSISKGGWMRPTGEVQEICLYGKSSSTCSFGSAMGFFAAICAIIFLLSDANFEKISAVQTRKRIVIIDMAISAIFTFLFIITFFSLWSKYGSLELNEPYDSGLIKFAIFCALISLIAWGGATFFVWRRYEEGARTTFATSYEQDFASSLVRPADYSYGDSGGESYQNAPFTAINTADSPIDIKQFQQGY